MKLPFDTIVFACKYIGFPSDAWTQHMNQLVCIGAWEYHHRENKHWIKHSEGYKELYIRADHNIAIGIRPYFYPKTTPMAQAMVKIQCGNLGLTATEVYAYVESVFGELAQRVYVKECHAKYDDTQHDFDWYRLRTMRKNGVKKARHDYDTTVYFGTPTGEELTIYDKVAEAKKNNRDDIFSQLSLCARVEKKVKYKGDEGMSWYNFLRYGMDRDNPFEHVHIGNIDALDKRTCIYKNVVEIGLYDYLREISNKRKRKQIESIVFAQPPIDLATEWYKRFDEWRRPFLAEYNNTLSCYNYCDREELQQAA